MPQIESFIQTSENISLHTSITTPTTPTSRPTLLPLHFWGGSNRTWAPLTKYLEKEFCIIAPSLRGWGQSSRPSDANAYRIVDYTTDILEMIQELKTHQPDLLSRGIVLVGHSMGGKIVQLLLTKLTTDLVKGVVLLAPAPSGSFTLPGNMREQQIHAYDSTDSAAVVMQNVLVGKPDNVDQKTLNSLATDAVSASAEAKAAWPAYGMVEDLEQTLIQTLSHAAQTPRVLVMVGELDRVETPQNVKTRVSELLETAGVDVKTITLENVGHLSPVEAPRQISEAVLEFATVN